MSYGVTPQGFKIKRLSDISDETTDSFKSAFGDNIDLTADDPLGNIKGILDERISLLWELAQDVYDSQYPATAEGATLDNVLSLTGTTRLAPQFSEVTGRIQGTLGTSVSIGFISSVLGNSDSRFVTTESGVIGAGIDEVQDITFSAVPTSGTWTVSHDGNIAAIQFNDTNAQIQTALRALASLTDVVVSGDYTSGFTVTYTGADGQKEQPELVLETNTLDAGGAVAITITETTKGFLPFVDLNMQAEVVGPVQALAGTLTVIETPQVGVTQITNLLDAIVGRDIESDPAAKLRQKQDQQLSGSATIPGIKNSLLEIDQVEVAVVIENASDLTDLQGRPPHSFEAVVLGGDEQEIANEIFNVKPAGIQTFGTVSKNVIDPEGGLQVINFSRPLDVDVYLVVNITPNTDPVEGALYPVDGDDQVEAKLLEFAEGLTVGNDVINSAMYTPVNEVPGVIGIQILAGTAPGPTLENNIPIDITEIAKFDSTRITVNS
jgi:uncharacterized phage protein gp47/JayE